MFEELIIDPCKVGHMADLQSDKKMEDTFNSDNFYVFLCFSAVEMRKSLVQRKHKSK